VKAYLDTNVLVAASVSDHPHHGKSFDLLKAIRDRAITGCVSTHGLAEFYSVITRAPFRPRVHPAEAGRLLDENILPWFGLVELSPGDYRATLKSCSEVGLAGGIVFDALHVCAAKKAACDYIYTFNVRDFRAIAPEELKSRIATP
jgi:predicted nucleic acid-binding protein